MIFFIVSKFNPNIPYLSHISKLVIMVILDTLLVTFIAVKKTCEHFLSRRKFQSGGVIVGED